MDEIHAWHQPYFNFAVLICFDCDSCEVGYPSFAEVIGSSKIEDLPVCNVLKDAMGGFA